MKKRFDRQSFLGADSSSILSNATVALIGAGGAGSHLVQQFAYVGIGKPRVMDKDRIEDTNLNRVVTAFENDVETNARKVDIAERQVRAVNSSVDIVTFATDWQENAAVLQNADIIVGCVDRANERKQLEETARQLCTPYVDIGMDIHSVADRFAMSGQVVVSIPGGPCLWCWEVLNDKVLREEAGRYGKAGGRPQVVWPNGVLASSAVGFVVDLLTGWSRQQSSGIYLAYDGNRGTLNRFDLQVPRDSCRHFSLSRMGAFRWGAAA